MKIKFVFCIYLRIKAKTSAEALKIILKNIPFFLYSPKGLQNYNLN